MRADREVITVAGRQHGAITVVHLHPADATRKHGIPVTSPARTLLDLAATTPARDLDRAVNEARVHRLASDVSLNEQFSRYPRHRGTQALKDAIRIEPALTRSEAERRALELIRAARLPTPQTNVQLRGYEVDFPWRELTDERDAVVATLSAALTRRA
jgi:hypothetical protein